ncbi:MAG: xanthine dehydrogenase family protein molybdopterin-binding subunit [Acidobacteriia bacterium]|nr:xanthine dehydrogenase family protein molybdopterin-binding subunit [Terriglobia bacterium]
MKATRRKFLKTTALAGTGLAIWLEIPKNAAGETATVFEPNAYISITPDNVVRLWMTRSEMGQGIRTTLPMMLLEELEASWSQVRLEQAMPGGRFKGIRLRTSGSGSTVETYGAMRKAGATAREMLIAAAAEKWKVAPASCHAREGTVIHDPSGRKLTYGELATVAARQNVPDKPPLKPAKDFRLIGTRVKRRDGAAIVTGAARYGLDVRVPGMLYAVMERCPVLGGKLTRFDAEKALAVPGVRHVAPIHSGIATGVAVVADHTWAAIKGREALHVEWDPGPNADFDSDRFLAQMESAVTQTGFPIRNDGDAPKAMAAAAKTLEATYEFPFQAHAPLETMNCTADVRPDSCEIWVPTQAPEVALSDTAKMLGLPEDSVKVHITLLGGGFGRRLFADYVPEAVELSRAIGKPVQLVWTRSDDMRHGFFHPSDIEHIAGGLDAGNNPVAWVQKSVGSDLSMFGLPSEQDKTDPKFYFNDGSPWGLFDIPYNFPHLKADYIPLNSPVPTGPWRAVMYPPTVFARESFLDEMAHAAGQDPLEFRLKLLQPGDVHMVGGAMIDRGRLAGVLRLAAEKSNWKQPLTGAKDRWWGRGIACNVYDSDTYVAQVAEVSVGREAHDIRVHRVVCAVDCGLVVNPAGLEGQAESAIIWGLSATLHGRIDFKNGGAVQENFTDFDVVRMHESPQVETYTVSSDHPPAGFGETAVPPIAPAVANAIFAATGKRLRRLPITAEKLKA